MVSLLKGQFGSGAGEQGQPGERSDMSVPWLNSSGTLQQPMMTNDMGEHATIKSKMLHSTDSMRSVTSMHDALLSASVTEKQMSAGTAFQQDPMERMGSDVAGFKYFPRESSSMEARMKVERRAKRGCKHCVSCLRMDTYYQSISARYVISPIPWALLTVHQFAC